MPAPPLVTKLFIPPPGKVCVDRPRLAARLNEGLHPSCRLVLVTAPAGFGKTTLLSAWGSNAGLPMTWITLDEGDNDPFRFLAYLVSAVEKIDTNLGQYLQEALQSSQHSVLADLLPVMVNHFSSVPRQFILVLDDYHLITAQEVHKAVTFFIEHCPPQMHLIIVTRKDPPFPIPLLRARGQLVELRQSDLRFTAEEVADYLQSWFGTTVAKEDVASLTARTEGWAAGLQMAALSIRERADISGLIASFSGGHEYIVDYFAAEVLDQQPESWKTFLLQTSILDQLAGPLCDAVTGQAGGQQMLEQLQQGNLFVTNLDRDRSWFRYHPLFKDLLEKNLRQATPGTLPELHRRASAWFEQVGLAEEAVEHALKAKDFERATSLIGRAVADLFWKRGESVTVLHWLEALPDQILQAHPDLCAFYAIALVLSGQFDRAETVLLIAEGYLQGQNCLESPPTPGDRRREEQAGMILAVRAYIAYFHGDGPGIIKYAQQALDLLPEQNTMWRHSTAINLGDACNIAGNLLAAQQAYSEAFLASRSAGNVFLALIAGSKLAMTYKNLGHLRSAEEICQQLLQLVNTGGEPDSRMMGRVYAIWGDILCEWNELEKAETLLRKAVDLSLQEGNVAAMGLSDLYLIRVLFARNQWSAVAEVLRKLERVGQESNMPGWIGKSVIAWKSWMCILQGRFEDAAQILREHGITPDSVRGYRSEGEYLTLARLFIAQDCPAEAVRLLEQLHGEAVATRQTGYRIVCLCLQAVAYHTQGLAKEARVTLEKAVSLAEPEGYLQVFIEEGQPMARLVYEIAAQGFASPYTGKLLAAFNEQPSNPPGEAVQSHKMVEPLSRREREVLRLLAGGLSNQEIAVRLVLSIRTVKFHASNIYSKLGVKSRTEAAARARSLGLLIPES